MSERKIFNFESIILDEDTFIKFGYYPSQLGRTSNKFVVATCRFCGEKMDIRKGFFNKSGSACHKKCKIEEQKINSPFKNKDIREKAQKTIEDKYGLDRKEIAEKISKANKDGKAKEKRKKTNIERYGVENVFQSENIKEKILKTNMERYGSTYPISTENVKEKSRQTCLNKYGVDNPMKNIEIYKKAIEKIINLYNVRNVQKNKEIKEKSLKKYNENIKDNQKYKQINILRKELFWDKLKESSLKEICKEYDLNYGSLTAKLSTEEFKEKYNDTYSFSKHQQQNKIYNSLRNISNIEIIQNTRKVISPLELDLYFPEHNLAIEFNGSYWHSEAALDRTIAYKKHRNKTDLCREKGIRLIHIFEHNWYDNEEKWIRYIKNILHLNKRKIFARKCILTDRICPEIIENNHVQGLAGVPKKYFSLEYEGEVVATMTASNHHRQNGNNNSIVLHRLVFAPDTNVVGGASRLFSAFKKWAINSGYSSIISWSDTSYSYGEIYETLGFVLDLEYDPDYFYWDSNTDTYRSKQSQMKKNTGCPENITERDWAFSKGLYRLWDCGKKRWVFNLKRNIL